MAIENFLYRKDYRINPSIHILIPTVGEVLEHEESYRDAVSILTAMPIDMMAPLDDAGIDFTQINDYELFLILFDALKRMDTSLIFGDMDLNEFELATNDQNGMTVLANKWTGAVIDREIHRRIADVLRKINHLKKDRRKPANNEAKDFMIRRAREKMRRNRNRTHESQLEEMIVALVCTEQYPYGFEQTLDLTIYQFYECVHQIVHKIDYDNKMRGVYAGTIDPKGLSQNELNWISHK